MIVPAAAGAIGGALVVAGSLLDWSGVAYSSRVDRALALAAGLVLIVVSSLAVLWRRRVLVGALAPAVLALNMGVVNLNDIAKGLYEYRAYPDAEVGIGIYLVLAGATLGVFAGVLGLAPRRWLGSSAGLEGGGARGS